MYEYIHTVGPLYLHEVPQSWIQPTVDQNIFKKFQKVPKNKTCNCSAPADIYIAFTLYYTYLHSIYIVLGIISNLEMI